MCVGHGLLPLVAAFALINVPAQGRDDGRFANSPLKGWFESLHSKGGGPCCADADGAAVADADWDTQGGHYRVRLQGEWIEVPDGRTLVRCFMRGSMT
jgi:hypothetical protein